MKNATSGSKQVSQQEQIAASQRTCAFETRLGGTKFVSRRAVKSVKKESSIPLNQTGCSNLLELTQQLAGCTRCSLSQGRTNIVVGEGSATARLMFVGEGPGEQEDLQGRPFVGRAGQLLDKIIEAIDLKREQVFIANVVKCRPPNNRAPQADEVAACEPFLLKQIALIQPQIIVALGATALRCLLHDEEVKISQFRGRFIDFQGAKLMPTYHPAYLLRNPSAKREVWEDMKQVRAALESGVVPNGGVA